MRAVLQSIEDLRGAHSKRWSFKIRRIAIDSDSRMEERRTDEGKDRGKEGEMERWRFMKYSVDCSPLFAKCQIVSYAEGTRRPVSSSVHTHLSILNYLSDHRLSYVPLHFLSFLHSFLLSFPSSFLFFYPRLHSFSLPSSFLPSLLPSFHPSYVYSLLHSILSTLFPLLPISFFPCLLN